MGEEGTAGTGGADGGPRGGAGRTDGGPGEPGWGWGQSGAGVRVRRPRGAGLGAEGAAGARPAVEVVRAVIISPAGVRASRAEGGRGRSVTFRSSGSPRLSLVTAAHGRGGGGTAAGSTDAPSTKAKWWQEPRERLREGGRKGLSRNPGRSILALLIAATRYLRLMYKLQIHC